MRVRKFIGRLLNSEDLPGDLGESHRDGAEVSAVHEHARNLAHSQTFAALEGWRPSSRSVPPDASPRRRPVIRRGQTLDVSRQDVERLVEEDELSSARSSALSVDSARPSAIRRYNANGKTYVPKRSTSPIPYNISHNTAGFSFSTSASGHSTSDLLSRRRSDGYAIGESFDFPTRPMNMKINSMINLPTTGVNSSLIRKDAFRGPQKYSRCRSWSSLSRGCQLSNMDVNDVTWQGGRAHSVQQLGNCIGHAQLGSVYRSLNLGTGQMVAIKRIRLAGMKEEEVRDVMEEVEMLKRLSHPSTVKYEGMSRDEEYLNIVLE